MIDKAERGRQGEEFAVDWLRKNGYMICARNWRYGRYEIDIVALRHGVMHFVEVKTRACGSMRTAEEAIDTTKRTALLKAMSKYIRLNRMASETQVDLAAVDAYMDGSFTMRYIENIMG